MSVSASAPVIPVTRTSSPRPRPAEDALGFGKYFADHMLVVEYTDGEGWHSPRIVPYGALALDPAASVLHYGQAMFEGLKAVPPYDEDDDKGRGPAGARRLRDAIASAPPSGIAPIRPVAAACAAPTGVGCGPPIMPRPAYCSSLARE